MTIRVRLALTYAAALAFSLVIVGAVVWWRQGEALRSTLDRRLTREAADLAATVERDGPEAIVEPGDQPDDLFVAVFDLNGSRVAVGPGVPADLVVPPPPAGITERELAGGRYLLYVSNLGDALIGIAGASLGPLVEAQARLAEAVFIAGALAALLSLGGGWWLAGRALHPVGELTAEAAAIDVSDLDHRLPVSHRQDELSLLARTLNAMLERIAGGIKRQRTFLAAASHDLRSPVAALQAELELADRPDADEAELRAALAAARGDAVRLGELTSSLLELVSAGVDGRALATSVVELGEIVEGAVRHVAPLAAQQGVTIQTEASPGTACVDRVRIEQAMRNLMANAVTYSPPGGVVDVVARIGADAETGVTTLSLDILDRGQGIAEAEREAVFEPFRRGVRARGQGSGLGLSTARAAAEAHGGTLRALARPGGGTWMSLRLPLGVADQRS